MAEAVVEVEIVPLPCRHIHRLTTKQETRPRLEGWSVVIKCHCGKVWKMSMHKGAIEAEPVRR